MTIITRSARVPYAQKQMFDLVNDIEAYPNFLPWCLSSRIISKEDDVIYASLALTKGGIQHTFSTQNRLILNQSITIELIDGPFKRLEGYWQFNMIDNNQGCHVKLDMDFELANRLIDIMLGPVFTQISGSLVDAFCKRAQQVYGSSQTN